VSKRVPHYTSDVGRGILTAQFHAGGRGQIK